MLHRKNPVIRLECTPPASTTERRLEGWPLRECGNPTNSHGKTLMNTITLRVSLTPGMLGCAVAVGLLLAANTARSADIIFTIQPGSHESIISVDDVYGPHEAQPGGQSVCTPERPFLDPVRSESGNPTSITFIGGTATTRLARRSRPAWCCGESWHARIGQLRRPDPRRRSEMGRAQPGRGTSIPTPNGGHHGHRRNFATARTPTSQFSVAAWMPPVPRAEFDNDIFVGAFDALSDGTWSVTESSPGSGDWTMTFNGGYNSDYNFGGGPDRTRDGHGSI